MAAQTQLPLSETLASEMSLFQLDETLSLLMESATEEAPANNGEIPDELRQALLDYCEAFGTKVDNIANYIKAQDGEARNAKIEIERLQARQASRGEPGREIEGPPQILHGYAWSAEHEGPTEHDLPAPEQPGLSDCGGS